MEHNKSDQDSSRTGRSGKSGSRMAGKSAGSVRSAPQKTDPSVQDDGLREIKINPIFMQKAANF